MGNYTAVIRFYMWGHEGGNGTIMYDDKIIPPAPDENNKLEYEIKDGVQYIVKVEGVTKSGDNPIQFHINFYEDNKTDPVHKLTIQANGESTFGAISINRYGTQSGIEPKVWTLHVGDQFDLRELSGGDSHDKYSLAADVAFIHNGTKEETIYPVLFYNYDGTILYSSREFKSPEMLWTTDYNGFKPYESEWFNYQASSYIETKQAGSNFWVTLNSIANIFYKRSPLTTDTDDMRIVLRCPKLADLDLGEIQSITDNYNSSLTPIPIIPYGHSNAFCMDTGVTRTITVNYKRVTPSNPQDDERFDSRKWSNSKWLEELRKYTNRWQQRTNGIHLYMFRPGSESSTKSMDECYPAINPNPKDAEGANWVNAYIIQCPISYTTKSTNMIESSITFQIGTIYPKNVASKKTSVKLTLMNDKKTAVIVSVMSSFTRNAWNLYPPMPAEFYSYMPGATYDSWIDAHDVTHKIGDRLYIDDIDDFGELIAVALDITTKRFYYEDGAERDITGIFKDGEPYTIYGIGGGGGGGDCAPDDQVKGRGGGGGGGAGFVKEWYYYHRSGQNVKIHIGKGGQNGRDGRRPDVEAGDGFPGDNTYVEVNGKILGDVARGGGRGQRGGRGGSQENKGSGGEGGSWSTKSQNSGRGGDGGSGALIPPGGSQGASADEHYFEEHGSGVERVVIHYGCGGGAYLITGGGGGGGMPDPRFTKDGKSGHGGNGGERGPFDPRAKITDIPIDGYLGGGGGGATDAALMTHERRPGDGGAGMIYIIGVFNGP